MKKKLLFASLIASIFSSAQINVNQNFETSSYAGFSYYSFYRSSVVFPCSGSYGATRNFWSGGTSGDINYVTLASNGGKLDISFKYKIYVYNNASVNGNLKIYYSIDGGNNFLLYDTLNLNSVEPVCKTWSTTFPQNFVQAGSDFRFRIEGNWTSGDYNVIIDDIVMSQSPFLEVSDVDKKQTEVYPNPFTNVVFINNSEEVTNISISDVSGRVLKNISQVSRELKLDDLKSGVYIMNINYKDGQKKVTKIIKK